MQLPRQLPFRVGGARSPFTLGGSPLGGRDTLGGYALGDSGVYLELVFEASATESVTLAAGIGTLRVVGI